MKDQPKRRALILTALPVEYAAVRAHLRRLEEVVDTVGTVYEVGEFGSRETGWTVCLTEVGAGNVSAAAQVERALIFFRPDVAIFVGIAGGIKDVALGDVVVATKVYSYESGKETAGGLRPRPEVANSAYRLIQRARAEARKVEWHQKLNSVASPVPRVFIGPIAAGEKVVASAVSETAKFLKKQYGDTLAIEMEGAGFLRGMQAHIDTAAIVIRGISDLLSGKHEADQKGFQKIASENASAFAMALLESLAEGSGTHRIQASETRKRVFVSYSHESADHQRRVQELARQLRADGIDCWIDQFEHETPSAGWPLWLEQEISKSDFVLVVCTEKFSRSFSGENTLDLGLGSAWEPQITYQTLRIHQLKSDQIIPVFFDETSTDCVPIQLRQLEAVRFPVEYERLLQLLTNSSKMSPPIVLANERPGSSSSKSGIVLQSLLLQQRYLYHTRTTTKLSLKS